MTPWVWPNAMAVRVIDGDTFTARLSRDLGFHGTAIFDVRLRLNRINAPAAKTPAGRAATGKLQTLLDGTGSVFEVTTVGPYKYGDEWMAEVVLPDGRNVSDEMVKAGVAVPWDGTGSVFEVTTVGPYKYGDEWMAEVVLPDGRNVSDEMVKAGVAVPWDGSGPRPGG